MLSGTAIAATIKVSWIAASDVRIVEGGEVGACALSQRLHEDRNQRQDDDQREKDERQRGQQQAEPGRLGDRRGGSAGRRRVMIVAPQPPAPPVPALQPVDDEQHAGTPTISTTVAIAVAPA